MSEPNQESIPSNLTPDEANRIIRSHRKIRYGTACWPCRKRKVKCDNKQPCENCSRRDHAGLCSYNPKQNPAKSSVTSAPSASASISTSVAAGVKRARSLTTSSSSSTRKEDDQWPRTTEDDEPNESRYIGQNSIPALLSEEVIAQEHSSDGEHEVIRNDIMPILGLQVSSAPYPFMSKEHLDKLRYDIARSLPSDKDVLRTFQTYKQISQPFWGLLVDIEDFESKLCIYLEERTGNGPLSDSTRKGVSSAWLGLLFAVLAVATNYSDLPYSKRITVSQSFVQSSFHCLRLSNFLIRPTIESIQALVNLGFVLSNDMKAEGAWALMGLTCRLAQALGLHRGSNESSRGPTPVVNDLPRRKLWWTILWQDSLLSLSFDRCPIATMTRCQLPLRSSAMTDGFTYLEAMYHVCQKILVAVKNDTPCEPNFHQIMKHCADIEDIRQQVSPALRTKEACKTVQDRLQHYALILHTSFVISVLCRPALRRGEIAGMDHQQKGILAEKCKANLTETVRLYLRMHSLSVIPTRSWAFTYHGLSSAVLLGIIGETKTNPEVRQLQGDLISALSTSASRESSLSSSNHASKDIELSGPLSRALIALKNLYDHGWVVETKVEPQTPPQHVQIPPSLERQDAAIAMASMQQHGTMLPPLEYQSLRAPGIQAAEQTMNMSPMDLYDSIFWEQYPQTAAADLPFDYAQPLMYQHFLS